MATSQALAAALHSVVSISLLSQSLREWALEAEVDLRPFAVCSDTKVGKKRGADAAVEYIAAQLASGAIRSDEAEEIWKLLRASGESDI